MKIYLASPYSHPDPSIVAERVEKVNKKAGELMMQGHIVFSPISHGHYIQSTLPDKLHNYDFWLRQDFYFIVWCDQLWIYMLEGWRESKGIRKEKEYAESIFKPVKYFI